LLLLFPVVLGPRALRLLRGLRANWPIALRTK
jgi:hypothetical protein